MQIFVPFEKSYFKWNVGILVFQGENLLDQGWAWYQNSYTDSKSTNHSEKEYYNLKNDMLTKIWHKITLLTNMIMFSTTQYLCQHLVK